MVTEMGSWAVENECAHAAKGSLNISRDDVEMLAILIVPTLVGK